MKCILLLDDSHRVCSREIAGLDIPGNHLKFPRFPGKSRESQLFFPSRFPEIVLTGKYGNPENRSYFSRLVSRKLF